MTNESTPREVGSNDQLGLVERLRHMSRCGHWPLLGYEAADEIERLLALADSEGSRAVSYLRRARKAEAALRELANAADAVGVRHFDTDWLDDEVQALKNATQRAREVLGPNTKSGAPRDRSEYMRAYYAANKAKLNARRKTYSRELARAAKARYLEKKRLLAEIAAIPVPTIEDA